MSEVRNLARGSTSDAVATEILAAISSGKYKPGDRLPTEVELAKQFHIGRTSVREGIGKLRVVGAVEVRRGVGTFIVGGESTDPAMAFSLWTAEHRYEIVDLFEVRIALETTAAALAASRATADEVVFLEQRAFAHAAAHDQDDLDLLVKTDQDFHEALVAYSKNQVLQRVYSLIVPELVPYRKRSLALAGAAQRSAKDHGAIVTAIKAGHPADSRDAALAHLSTLYEEILKAR